MTKTTVTLGEIFDGKTGKRVEKIRKKRNNFKSFRLKSKNIKRLSLKNQEKNRRVIMLN